MGHALPEEGPPARPSGYSNLSDVFAIFNTSVSGANACYIRYNQASNLLYVADSTGTNWSNGIVPGSSSATGNFSPNCTINGGGSSVSAAGTQLSVTAYVTFQTAFSGTKNEYLFAQDNATLSSEWQQLGTWTVAAPPVLSIAKTHPGNFTQGQSGAQYTVTVSNTSGAGPTSGTVTVTETVPTGLSLVSMAGTGWTCGGATCTRSDALAGGASYPPVTVTVNVAGNAATPQVNSVSVSGGGAATATATDSTVIGPPPPPANGPVSPASGSGTSGAFSFTSSSSGGYANIQWMELLFNSYNTAANGCFLAYWPGSRTVGLAGNDGSTWPNTGVLGTGTIQNSQCQVNLAASYDVQSGNSVTLTLAVSFYQSFAGTQQIWMQTGDDNNLVANWQQMGTWTVPAPAPPPTVTTTSLPSGTVGVAYSATLAASGGVTPYAWSLASGSLPAGVTLSSGGAISGMPTATGTFAVTVKVTGADGLSTTSGQLSFTISQSVPVLSVTLAHAGSLTQAQSGATYSVAVTNTAGGPTSGTVTVAEVVPAGLLPASMSGTGWTCQAGGITCTRGDPLSAGASYAPITVTMNVAPNAPSQVTNQVTVSGGGSASAAASDTAMVNAVPRYANPLAFATSASVVGGVPTTFAVTYTSDNGPADIASGQVQIDNCYFAWDSSGHLFIYPASEGGGQVNGFLGQTTTISGGNCSINLANSSLSTPASNPKALVLSLEITFPEQAYPNTDDRYPPADFIGPHEVYAWGVSASGLNSGQVDLGSLAVSQGPDFTLTLGTSESAVNLGTGATLVLTLSSTGLNGFNGSIALGTQILDGSNCFDASWPTSMPANSQTTITVKNNSCAPGGFENLAVHGSVNGIRRTTSSVTLHSTAAGDFNIGVGAPSPAVLVPPGGVSYAVSVSSSNGQAGAVSLSLDTTGLPAGVTYSFSPQQVSLNAGGTATSYLTFYGSAGTPPGSYPLHVAGILGGTQHTAVLSLSTQVTTFQVASPTGSAILHNTGQEVQVTHSVPAGNVPTNATCASGDQNVSCRVISSSAGTVTLGITASPSAAHGTRVLKLNGGAAMVHVAIADGGGGFALPTIEVNAGGAASREIDVSSEPCYLDGPCGFVTVTGSASWIGGFGDGGWVTVQVDPPLTAALGSYSYSVDLCSGFWDPGDNYGCESSGVVEVDAPLPPPPPNPRILLNGIDVTGKKPTVVVGQQIVLSANVDTGTLASPPWTVQGTTTGGWIVTYSPDPGSATSATISDADFTVASPTFYWVAGGTNMVTLTVTDGTGAKYTASTTATVVAPAYKIDVSKDTVGIVNGHVIQYGVNSPGVSLVGTITAPAGFASGGQQWIQLVVSSTSTFAKRAGGTPFSVCRSSGLDTRYPYSPTTTLNDSPNLDPTSISGTADASVADSFDSYLMWKPNMARGIFVPIAHVTWNWFGEALLNDQNVWVLDTDHAPTNPDPQKAATSQFPTWSTNVRQQNCGAQ